MKYSIIFNILFIICLVGCTNSELEKAKATIDRLHAENAKIRQDILKLKGDCKASKLENERLSIRIKELNQWSKKLADGYGTGIWITDESTYPIFVKSMKSANVNDIINELNQLREDISSFFSSTILVLKEKGFVDIEGIIVEQKQLIDRVTIINKKQLKRIKNQESGTKNSTLYLNVMNETKNLLLFTVNLIKAQRDFLIFDNNQNVQPEPVQETEEE